MMRQLRDKKTMQVILWGLIAAFVVGFVFLAGGRWMMKEDTRNLVAQVGDKNITYAEFDQAYKPASERLYSAKDSEPSSEEVASLKKQVLEHVIDNTILEKTAKDMGISVSIEEIAATIQRQSYFNGDNGKFDRTRYIQVLQANQITPEEFEAAQGQQILLQKIHSILDDSMLYTTDDLTEYSQLLGRQLKARYIVLVEKKFEKEIPIKDADLNNYYDNHRNEYDHPERAKARHILIGLQGASPLDEEKAKKELEGFREQILKGKSKFAELAAKYSQDSGSRNSGGELGWVPRGAAVKEFDDVLFKLKKGEISKPFKTPYGYHIAQMEDYEKEYTSKFAEVRMKVSEKYRMEKTMEKILAISEKLSEKLNHEGIDKAGKELGLAVQTTSWFDRHSGIPRLKDSKNAADSLASLYLNQWKGPLAIGTDEYFFQIVDVKTNGPYSSQNAGDLADIAKHYLSDREAIWIKDFLESQRKSLKVRTFSL